MTFGAAYIKILLITLVLFVFIIPGFVLRKKGYISDGVIGSLSNILIYVCQPFLMIKAFTVNPVEPSLDIFINMLFVMLFTLLSMLIVFGISKLVFIKNPDRKRKDVYSFISMFSNCGFFGIPFVDMLTGGDSEALIYMATYNFAFNILIWTIGVYLMTQDKKDISIKHAFLNPAMIGSYIGILLFFVPVINIFNMEEVIELQQIPVCFATVTTVLSMIVIGIRLADIQIKNIFNQKGSYIASLLRLIVSPAIALGLCMLVDKCIYSFESNYVWLAVVIASAVSPASFCVAYAEKFDGDKEAAATTYILATLLSIITVPLIVTGITFID